MDLEVVEAVSLFWGLHTWNDQRQHDMLEKVLG